MRPRFAHEVLSEGEEARIALSGELDMAATLKLEPVVDRILDAGTRSLVLDLSELTFIDSTGMALLVGVNERAGAAGAHLTLLRPQEHVGRVLEVTGLDGLLPLS